MVHGLVKWFPIISCPLMATLLQTGVVTLTGKTNAVNSVPVLFVLLFCTKFLKASYYGRCVSTLCLVSITESTGMKIYVFDLVMSGSTLIKSHLRSNIISNVK